MFTPLELLLYLDAQDHMLVQDVVGYSILSPDIPSYLSETEQSLNTVVREESKRSNETCHCSKAARRGDE